MAASITARPVRCLPSGFIGTFTAEKRRLQAQGLGAQQSWKSLEAFNVGRLRVASKGLKRSGGALLRVDGDTQQRFHIGVMSLRGHGVPEEYKQVDRALRDLRSNLLVAPKRSALQLMDIDAQLLLHQPSGGAGGVEFVLP